MAENHGGSGAAAIEIEIGGATLRVGGGGRAWLSGQGATSVEGHEMISALSGALPAGVRVLIATRPVDFRRGADSLAAMVQIGARAGPLLRHGVRVPLETGGPGEDAGL